MRFLVANGTGMMIHVRLDHGTDDAFVLTVSRKKVTKGKPLSQYVIAPGTVAQIIRLDARSEPEIRNPDGLVIVPGGNDSGDGGIVVTWQIN
jgi:hypothetical protein